MRFSLFITGLFCYLFTSVCIAQNNSANPQILPFSNVSDSTIGYHASIKLPGQKLSGLIYLRKIDNASYHLVMITEMGMSLFELQIHGQQVDSANFSPLLQNEKFQSLVKSNMVAMVHAFTDNEVAVFHKKNSRLCFKFASFGYSGYCSNAGQLQFAKTGKGTGKQKLSFAYFNPGPPNTVNITYPYLRIKWKLQRI